MPEPAAITNGSACSRWRCRIAPFAKRSNSGAAEEELRDLLRTNGTRSLLADALAKVSDGVTTLDEVRSMTWVPLPDC